jgi:hypothetical protein
MPRSPVPRLTCRHCATATRRGRGSASHRGCWVASSVARCRRVVSGLQQGGRDHCPDTEEPSHHAPGQHRTRGRRASAERHGGPAPPGSARSFPSDWRGAGCYGLGVGRPAVRVRGLGSGRTRTCLVRTCRWISFSWSLPGRWFPGLAEQFADARDDLVAVQVDVGHELLVGQAWHAVLEVEAGGAEGAEIGGDLVCDGFG